MSYDYRVAKVTTNGGVVGMDDSFHVVQVFFEADGKICHINPGMAHFGIAEGYKVSYLKEMFQKALLAFDKPVLDLTYEAIGFCWNDKPTKKIDYENLKYIT